MASAIPGARDPGRGTRVNDSMVRLAIDFENPAPEWWEAGGRDLWESVVEGFDNNAVLVERSIAVSWLEQAAQDRNLLLGPAFQVGGRGPVQSGERHLVEP